jgi:hypothetical protein
VYFDRFFARARPVLERQLSRASAGVAAVIVSAWQAGGRPDMPLTVVTPDRKKRAPAATGAAAMP